MDKFFIYIALFAVFAVIAAVVNHYTKKAEAKRSTAMAEAAAELKFDFDPLPDPDLLEHLAGFWLFGHGHSKQAWNRLRGSTNDLDVQLFDYQYVTGGGKNKQVFAQTVVRFRRPGTGLPFFTLRPESFWHKVGALFGSQDIDFDSHPKFSKQYLLKGKDEEAVRDTFTPEVLDYFEENPGLCVEAVGDELLFYRQKTRTEPTADSVKQLLADGFEVIGLFPGVAVADERPEPLPADEPDDSDVE